LEHTFTMNMNFPHYPVPIHPPVTRKPLTTTKMATRKPSYPIFQNNYEEVCGLPKYGDEFTGLIVRGGDVFQGQFPWLVAYFHNDIYQCGGSLVSRKIVVTAAHCIRNKNSTQSKTEENAELYLGTYDIDNRNNETNSVIRKVSTFIIHPDWNQNVSSFDADIAIMVMKSSVEFNNFIRPICIWSQTDSFEDIIGVNSVVAGWGTTELDGDHSNVPKFLRVSAVNNMTCLSSHRNLHLLISTRNFCAMAKKTVNGDSGVCNGDSGSAYITINNNKSYLRGIVSSSLTKNLACDITNYAIYTDVAKFAKWINGFIISYD
jgi:secreted trypsin-like serine protease